MNAESCVAPRVSIVVPDGTAWQDATAELGERLRTLHDLDKCARVSVRPSGSGVVLDITTGDGRRATRQVASVPELLRTAEALLVLPPEAPQPVLKPSPLELPPAEVAPATATVSTHVDLGVAAALRFGGTPLYVGGGVTGFAQLALDGWLVCGSFRVDAADGFVSQLTPSDFYMESGALGVSVGRRWAVSKVNVDALLGTSLVLETQDADDGNQELEGVAGDFRLALAMRVSGPRAASTRVFATGDLEGSPARVRTARYIDRALPELPWWSTGLAVGVLWGVR